MFEQREGQEEGGASVKSVHTCGRVAAKVSCSACNKGVLLVPANDVLTVEYNCMISHASLTAFGQIRFNNALTVRAAFALVMQWMRLWVCCGPTRW